jgi:hypothetical protein
LHLSRDLRASGVKFRLGSLLRGINSGGLPGSLSCGGLLGSSGLSSGGGFSSGSIASDLSSISSSNSGGGLDYTLRLCIRCSDLAIGDLDLAPNVSHQTGCDLSKLLHRSQVTSSRCSLGASECLVNLCDVFSANIFQSSSPD